jgi:hypothetical protein
LINARNHDGLAVVECDLAIQKGVQVVCIGVSSSPGAIQSALEALGLERLGYGALGEHIRALAS